MNEQILLRVQDLSVDFRTEQGTVHAVRNVSFFLQRGEILGIVGESGSGKSATAYAIMGLLPKNGTVTGGTIRFDGQDISPKAFADEKRYEEKMRGIRGNHMSMIFQDPMTFLNPVLKIGDQLAEPIRNHCTLPREQIRERVLEMMRQVGIADPERRLRQYPHKFSGGMRQRIVIAGALVNRPKLLIADEPTTALDVTIQAQILELLKTEARQNGMSVMLITHDLTVAAGMCDRVLIFYGGKIVEEGSTEEIFYEANHPYTKGLLGCISPMEDEKKALTPIPGGPPDPLRPRMGCPFMERCPKAMRICKLRMPEICRLSPTHKSACWRNELAKRKGDL